MNELNEKAINMCQAMIGFKPGVSDGDIDTAISTVTSLPMFAGLNKIELKKSLLSIYNVKVVPTRFWKDVMPGIPWLKEFKAECRSEWAVLDPVQEIPGRTEAFWPRGYLPTG